jgi:hypothetical protein
MLKPNSGAKPAKLAAPQEDRSEILGNGLVQLDMVADAQLARPALTRTLLAANDLMVAALALALIAVGVSVIRSSMAEERVYASMPSGETYEVVVHEDELRARDFERQASRLRARNNAAEHQVAAQESSPASESVAAAPASNP